MEAKTQANASVHAPQLLARRAQLRYIRDSTTRGIKRIRQKGTFLYVLPDGKIAADTLTLDRIKALIIPPAWNDVWISPNPDSHLQATGRDEKGRKQYIYHEEWNRLCQQNKFQSLAFFGDTLPSLRRRVRKDMYTPGLQRQRILATLIWLLSNTFVRVGNVRYAKANNSFGLTTLRVKHVKAEPDRVELKFKGKSGVKHIVDITHPRVVRTIRKCIELPGYDVFQYADESGTPHVIDASDINSYLKEITGAEITAKDFRTWGGTVLATKSLMAIGPYGTKTALKKNISLAVKDVASHLRNTAAVCRSYYIHPTVLSAYRKNDLIPFMQTLEKHSGNKPRELTSMEYAVLGLLKKYPIA